MIFDYTSFYLSCNYHGRLIRYDVIKLDYESYLVKVFDDKSNEMSDSNLLVQVSEF